jgi:hypothetical protein
LLQQRPSAAPRCCTSARARRRRRRCPQGRRQQQQLAQLPQRQRLARPPTPARSREQHQEQPPALSLGDRCLVAPGGSGPAGTLAPVLLRLAGAPCRPWAPALMVSIAPTCSTLFASPSLWHLLQSNLAVTWLVLMISLCFCFCFSWRTNPSLFPELRRAAWLQGPARSRPRLPHGPAPPLASSLRRALAQGRSSPSGPTPPPLAPPLEPSSLPQPLPPRLVAARRAWKKRRQWGPAARAAWVAALPPGASPSPLTWGAQRPSSLRRWVSWERSMERGC